MQVRHLAVDRIAARRGKNDVGVGVRTAADGCQSCVDDLGVGHREEHVIPTRPVFLEVGRLPGLDEGVQEVPAVQRVGLEPFFSVRFPGRSGMGDDCKFALHEVPDNHLAREG